MIPIVDQKQLWIPCPKSLLKEFVLFLIHHFIMNILGAGNVSFSYKGKKTNIYFKLDLGTRWTCGHVSFWEGRNALKKGKKNLMCIYWGKAPI